MAEYRRGAHTVYEIHLHLVWTTKYRKNVLAGEVATRARDLIREICGTHDVKIMKGARVERSCASAGVDTATGDDQSAGAVAEGKNGAQDHAGISTHQEALLGATHVGARIFLLQHRKCDG